MAQEIKVDFARCQGMWRGGSFMTFGPRQMVQCDQVPIVVAREPRSPHGKMSLCATCAAKCVVQVPGVLFRAIIRQKNRKARMARKPWSLKP